ncbi:hypothetical protein QBC33DRAFT_529975 [Phialemonium atrogriseum]|uniref:Uncharacterized protein n=1 Tax=Phialemonium atrogriseum TaxID=1093897 RepID=A0AAJ0C7A2_9PEZI|nr:uncharacterized protein QBC33DRAFT_529975 [Phialemonium atrogriseum]KAK1770032.1 hypothetical protein QBC33DRAFT_529975 [Phialemonium atrogriseum]
MGALYIFASVGYIIWMVLFLHNPDGIGPPAEAPANLNLVARVAYYALHPRCGDWFLVNVIAQLVVKGCELLEERRWPSFSWGYCLGSIAFLWSISTASTRLDAYRFGRPAY